MEETGREGRITHAFSLYPRHKRILQEANELKINTSEWLRGKIEKDLVRKIDAKRIHTKKKNTSRV